MSDYGGKTNVLVNYYLTKINLADDDDCAASPELSLDEGASEALDDYLRRRGKELPQSIAFELGLKLGALMSETGARDPEETVRRMLAEAIAEVDRLE